MPAEPVVEPFLRIEGMVKAFDGTRVVDGIDLAIARGEVFALLGPSGCGKSTLLRLLAGFEHPDAGRIVLGGRDLAGVPPFERPINMMFQSYALFPHLSARDNIAFGLERMKLPRAEVATRVQRMLELVQLEPHAQRKPHQLSGGQQQRVALARSLAREPQLLLLDEPLGALDRKLREHTRLELSRIIQQVGVTCVLVTHDQDEAMTMADRIAVMDGGRLLQLGTPSALYENPSSRFVAGFIGRVNLMDGRVAAFGPDHAIVDSADCRHQVAHGVGGAVGAEVGIALRPEKVHLSRHPPAGDPLATNTLHGRIVDRSYHGSHTVYRVRGSHGTTLEVSLSNTLQRRDEEFAPGDEAWAHWSRTAAVVLSR